MSLTSFLHTQHPAAGPVDDTVFDTARLVIDVEHTFTAPRSAVWAVLDGTDAWSWLPFPGCGVRYHSPERGAGVVREMGSVAGPWRVLWVERERFWRHQPGERITFGVISGNWMQYLLVRQYAENMSFTDTAAGGTRVVWTIAVTPRFPLRFATWFPTAWRLAYRYVGLNRGIDRRARQLAAETPSISRNSKTAANTRAALEQDGVK
ncbi:SRPBCC family protein [Nocardia sp. NPDC051832]|uniref:SRPBCC family protein n=1 Tax=Nocardia sp. NPDC051832 TaxID=3155673 RepID=UPI003446F5AA